MKGNILQLLLTLIIVLIFSNNLSAKYPATDDISKDELKYTRLLEKVNRIKIKISATSVELLRADSLEQVGFKIKKEAKNEIKNIREQEKIYIKTKNTERKNLWKQYKIVSDDKINGIEDKVKKLDYNFKVQLRTFYKRYKTEERNIKKARSYIQKGKYKRNLHEPKLKDYQKELELAVKDLKKFKFEKNL